MAIQTLSKKRRRKLANRPANYYNNMRKELAAGGPAQAKYSKKTNRNLRGVWKRWVLLVQPCPFTITQLFSDSLQIIRYSEEAEEPPIDYLKSVVPANYKAFFTWVLDRYPGVRKKSSLHQYWRQLKMLYKKHARKLFDPNVVDDVNNVSHDAQDSRG